MLQSHGDAEKERRRETKRREGAFLPSLRLSVSPSLCLSVSLSLCLSVAGQIGSFEKRAISWAQEISASDLDAALPNRPFAGWFSEVIGPKAGVVWQLTECGDPLAASGEAGQDLPACAEGIANLPGGRKIFVAISVGTFKKGLTGKPSFFSADIQQNGRAQD